MGGEPCILCDNGEQALCNARRGATALSLHGSGMFDSMGVARCLNCLRTVDPVRILQTQNRELLLGPGIAPGTRFYLGITPIRTGYELLCCGGGGEPFIPGGEK